MMLKKRNGVRRLYLIVGFVESFRGKSREEVLL